MTNEQIDDGGPAFPHLRRHIADNTYIPIAEGGMSLRDWFAGQALASMTIAADYSKGPCNSAMADRAYLISDAMLAARKGGRK